MIYFPMGHIGSMFSDLLGPRSDGITQVPSMGNAEMWLL